MRLSIQSGSELARAFGDLFFLPNLYAVGGCVRDLLLGNEPGDFDFATSLTPGEVKIAVAEFNAARSMAFRETVKPIEVVDVGETHGTLLIRVPRWSDEHNRYLHPGYEVTTFRKDVSTDGRRASVKFAKTIEEDLARRDFTMNAIAIDANGNIVDPFNGVEDLRFGLLRAVGNPIERFQEDYLRIVRLARFANKYRFAITLGTLDAAETLAPNVPHYVSVERVVMEFEKAFTAPKVSEFLQNMLDWGILEQYVPEFRQMVGMEQNPEWHPEGDVWAHTLGATDRAPASHRWHVLFHDIGKPATAQEAMVLPAELATYVPGGYFTFKGHEEEGALLIENAIGERLKWSAELTKSVAHSTRHHMRVLNFCEKPPTAKAARRFQAAVGLERLSDLEIVCRADGGNRRPEHVWDVFEPQPVAIERVLKGRHLIEAGFKPGPHFGPALDAAYEVQIDEGCDDVEALLSVAKESLTS